MTQQTSESQRAMPAEPAPALDPESQQGASSELRRRAASGVAIVGLRAVGIQLMSLVGNVAIARVLAPRDLGVVAIGTTIVTAATFLSDGGAGAGMIRGRLTPSGRDLEHLLGLQIVVASILALVTALATANRGLVGAVTAVMVIAVPIAAARAPGVIVMERQLRYGPVAVAELAEAAGYYAVAIAGVLSGLGVWALAIATVVRAGVGTTAVLALGSTRIVRPRVSLGAWRGLLGFGAKFQGQALASLVRDQGLNGLTAAMAGLPVLGLWSVATRILQVPFWLFYTLWRVSYPAMARLIESGENPRPLIERTARLVAVATGLIVVPLAASAHTLVPALLGQRWAEAADPIPWAAAGLMIGGPVSVATGGYLYAVGAAGAPLRATLAHTAATFAVAVALLPTLGVTALGLAWLASGIVDAAFLGRAAARRSGAQISRQWAPVAALALVGAVAGLVAAHAAAGDWLSTISSAGVSEATFVALLLACQRDPARDLLRTVLRGFGGALGGRSPLGVSS